MLSYLKQVCLTLLISTTPLSVMAHSGHDHQSQWAFLIHLLWLAPVIFAGYIAVNFVKNKQQARNK